VTLARRVAALEASLSPTQLVLRWLAEAHAHGSLVAYVPSILDDPPEAFPLNRLAREAATAARAGSRSRVREQTDAAVRTALQQTVFRFELVMRINITTHELLDREALVQAAIMGHMALLANEPAKRPVADPAHLERLMMSRDLTLRRVIELHAVQEARSIAETRYLDGHPALFPDGLQAWDAQVHETERLAVMADRLAELDGLGPSDLDDEEAVAIRLPEVLADLVEPAKATALEKLGEGERSIRLATDWLRARFYRVSEPGQGLVRSQSIGG
jgi:hypothetical protein